MVYAFIELTVTDPDMFAAYAKQAGGALAKHGGAPVAQSAAPTVLEGDGAAPGRAVVLSFPDKEAALAWIGDADLADIHAKRRASGHCRITLVA